ncbi:MAG: hypothetical protein LBK70_03250 [Clostridiales bacterium]|jgi:hypothetical protein|nr:hypothetical protein [Clostridiales bacterium]
MAEVKKGKKNKKNSNATDKGNGPQKSTYVMCPRCELNFMLDVDEYCYVCKAEIGLVDKSILMPDPEEIGEDKLCPICNLTYIAEDEEFCFLCAKDKADKIATRDVREAWNPDVDEQELLDDDDNIEISLEELEEKEELDEQGIVEHDDFEYVNTDEMLEDLEDEDDLYQDID